MSPQQLKWIALALGAALLLWLASELVTQAPDDRETARAIPSIATDSVAMVVVTRGGEDSIVVGRFGSAWQVNGLEASPGRIDELLAALRDTAESEVAATNAALHERMGVDAGGTVVEVRGLAGGKVASFIVGKAASDNPRAAYIRRSGTDTVYHYDGGLVRLAALAVDDWRDKRIADVDPASVRRLILGHGGTTTELVRRDSAWMVGGARADSAAVARILAALHPLEATGFPGAVQLDSVGWNPPDRRLTVLGAAGDTLAALVFDSTAGAYWVRRAAGGTVFTVPAGRADRILPEPATFLPRATTGS